MKQPVLSALEISNEQKKDPGFVELRLNSRKTGRKETRNEINKIYTQITLNAKEQ